MRNTRCVGVIAVVAVLGLGGCQGTRPATPSCEDPDLAVARLRQSWQSTTVGGRCGTDVPACGTCASDPASKQLLRRQGENLAYTNPRHVPTLMFAALTAYEARDNVRAMEHLDDVLQLQPDHADAALLRARISMEEGNFLHARRLLQDQIALHPDHAGLYEALASVRFLEGHHDDALAALDAAGRLGAPTWRVAYNRGVVEEGRGNTALAIAHYERSLASLPNWAPPTARLRGLRDGIAATDGMRPPVAMP